MLCLQWYQQGCCPAGQKSVLLLISYQIHMRNKRHSPRLEALTTQSVLTVSSLPARGTCAISFSVVCPCVQSRELALTVIGILTDLDCDQDPYLIQPLRKNSPQAVINRMTNATPRGSPIPTVPFHIRMLLCFWMGPLSADSSCDLRSQ